LSIPSHHPDAMVMHPKQPAQNHRLPMMAASSFECGITLRNRDWVLLPSEAPDVHLLRPLTGATDELVAVYKQLTDLIGYELPAERVRSAAFPLPSPDNLSDANSAYLLWQAARRARTAGMSDHPGGDAVRAKACRGCHPITRRSESLS
jgi:hypothetical protein